MDNSNDWQLKFDAEISNAERARRNGNEGKTRVCARRAAGIVLGEYFRRRGYSTLSPSAYDLLQQAVISPIVPAQAAEICRHLLVRLTPDFNLPVQVDLVSDALSLRAMLLAEAV